MADLLLGIDIGTGGCKTTLINQCGMYISDGFAEYETYHPKLSWSEQKPADWFPAFLKALKAAERKGKVGRKDIIGISVSASSHNAVLLDAHNAVLRDTIMWTDQRSYEESEYLKKTFGERIFQIGYQIPAPTWTISQLLWLKRNEPEVFGKIRRIMFIKDYVRYQLTGTWCTDYIEAQGSLLFDNLKWTWSDELCGMIDLPPEVLPPIVNPSDVVGKVTPEAAKRTGLPEGIPVINGASDTALEHYCVGGIHEGNCVVKVATASTVNIFSSYPKPHPTALTYSQVPQGIWSTCFATSSAAASLRWYRDTFCEKEALEEELGGISVYQTLDAEASAVKPGSGGLFFHPYLMGERSPYWDPKLRGSFVGITASHTRGHFNRAILEGVAYSIKENFNIAEKLQHIQDVRLVGGGAKSGLWASIICNMLNRPIIRFEKDDSSFGAAMLAGVGIGIFRSHEDAIVACTKERCRVYPEATVAELYNTEFSRYRQIHEDLKDVYSVEQLEK